MLHHLDQRQKIIIMLAVMSALFLVALDQTIIATALSKIVQEFDSYSSLGWVVTAYLLTSTVTIPIAGKISDLYGRRPLLLIGVAIFTLSSFLSGSAQDINQLIYFRALQGVGGGIIMANAFTIIGDLFSPRERGRWQGLIGAVFGLSSVIGPLLGGWLSDSQVIFGLTTSWRWTFWINIPVGILSFTIVAIYAPALKKAAHAAIDYLGAIFLTLGLTAFILAIDNTDQIFASFIDQGFSLNLVRTILLTITALSTLGFIWAEKQADSPIIPLRFFRNRTFSSTMAVALLFGAAFLGAILYLTQFNQQVFGANATESGLMLLPMIAGLSLTAALSGQLISRTGKYKTQLIAGLTLAAISIFSLTSLNPATPYWHEAIIMVFIGIGLGSAMPVLTLAVQNEFKLEDIGAATASSQLFRGLGSTIGTAILGSVLTAGLVANLGDLQQNKYIQLLSQQPQVTQQFDTINANTALTINSPQVATQIRTHVEQTTQQMPESVGQPILDQFLQLQNDFNQTVLQAFSDSLRSLFLISGTIMSLAVLVAFGIVEKPLRGDSDDTPMLGH